MEWISYLAVFFCGFLCGVGSMLRCLRRLAETGDRFRLTDGHYYVVSEKEYAELLGGETKEVDRE